MAGRAPEAARENPSYHVSFLLIPRFNMLTLTGLLEPLRVANYLARQTPYSWDYRSVRPGSVTASNGLTVDCQALEAPERAKPESVQPDLAIVLGSWGAEHYDEAGLSNWLRRQKRRGVLLIAVELGVYALARAGLLDGRRATTHWSWKAGFVEAFPEVEVVEQLYTLDGNPLTCAGGTAGLDLMLTLLARQQGEQLAREVANQILYCSRRPPEGAQRIASGGGGDATLHPDVRAALALLEAGIEEPLRVPQLCRELGVSQRQLERLFRQDMGCSIVQFGRLLRLQYARTLLTGTDLSIRDVSAACGFNSLSYFSLCFSRTFGRKPSDYRRSWPESEPSPSWPGTVYAYLQEQRARGPLGAG